MRFVLRRLGFFVVTLWAAVSLNFLIPRLMPGNPVQALEAQHPHLGPQAIHALTVLLGGRPAEPVAQYFEYWKHVLTFNFGISITTSFGTSVTHDGAARPALDPRAGRRDDHPRLHPRHAASAWSARGGGAAGWTARCRRSS